ncbi:MacB family efflux pump subunit [Polaromonas sp.]|uniref:MacB family efflux pump subunit n=1 Tax=Polaromonas sp. TaxID=1869339 RepID=UPI002FCB7401
MGSVAAAAAGVEATPLLVLKALRREFPAGDETIAVLKDVDLTIQSGEMVAIVGASGSGKSTLMNILGCLDRPTTGSYRVAGRETGQLSVDELAELRREHFGFIFQRYHLLPDLHALGNVEVPAVYAGRTRQARHARAAALLTRLGLADRMHHKPGQLSGGQQQRVSIARALMNGGHVILADEPTGALDSHSGAEVMKILEELHAEGHTIIIVTHDMQVARHADRIIEISDGEIVADRLRDPDAAITSAALAPPPVSERSEGPPRASSAPEGLTPAARGGASSAAHEVKSVGASSTAGPPQGGTAPSGGSAAHEVASVGAQSWQAIWGRFTEAFHMALLAMHAHRLRTFLTMLGIIIGIASVVSVVALGEGSRLQILKNISAIGTNTIEIFSGSGFGDQRAARVRTLVPGDAQALAEQAYVDSVTPTVNSSATLRYGNIAVTGTINGVGEQYFRVRGVQLAMGRTFDQGGVAAIAQEVVIDDNTRKQLFPDTRNPVGQVILLGSVPCRVVGVAKKSESAFGNQEALNVWVPYTAVMRRVTGQNHLRSITVRVSDEVSTEAAEQGINTLLKQRHGVQDFYVLNTDTIRQTIESTTKTMTLLISAIALISLIVGGIGVMNIMLVSVTERTKEIGVRMAVGARQSDIRQQFLIEAVLVCLLGGILGIGLSLLTGVVLEATGSSFTLVYSTLSMVAAFVCSTLIGVIFGFLPASNAAQLDPVDALARE